MTSSTSTLNLSRKCSCSGIIFVLSRRGSNVISEDMSWMAKLKKNAKSSKVTGFMEKVVVQSKNRIPQRQVDEMLANKYRKQDLVKRTSA